MLVDLKKYAGFNAPELKVERLYNTKEDYQAMDAFNRKMTEVHRDYVAKEKKSSISAKKLVLTV